MSQCISCKGRGLCGRPVCPIIRRLEELASLPRIGERIEGYTPPEVFVGRQGYPLVCTGPLIPVGNKQETPNLLSMDIGEIIALRASTVRSESRVRVKDAAAPGKLLEAAQAIAMSSSPVGTDVQFLKAPSGRIKFDGMLMPTGPVGSIREMSITTNPVIPRKVDSIVEDRGASALVAVNELYSSKIDVDHISRLLSLGLLGRERKLVPTRWSITASDDMVGKSLSEKVLDLPLVEKYQLYSGEVLGNHFEILLMPEAYSFELVEIWRPGSAWAPEGWIGSDFENGRGKSGYSPLAGGYYASRLAILERLATMGRQARILAVREISESYFAPLGVWVVREAARSAMRDQPRNFSTLSDAMKEMESRIKTQSEKWKTHSKLIFSPKQSRLSDFLKK